MSILNFNSMATGADIFPGVLYLFDAHGQCWVSVDLGCLPEKPTRVTKSILDLAENWTVVDGDIYCTVCDSMMYSTGLCRYSVRRHKWETVSFPRKLPRRDPIVFSIDKKIYVLGGYMHDDNDRDGEGTEDFQGEVYDLNSKTWNCVLKGDISMFGPNFTARFAAFDMKEKTVVFYSFLKNTLLMLIYDAVNDKVRQVIQPSFNDLNVLKVLQWDRKCIHYLQQVTQIVNPVLADSTLYWFGIDKRLYGYAFDEDQWLRSPIIEEISLWPPSAYEYVPENDICPGMMPILVSLGGGKLLVMIELRDDKVWDASVWGMAMLEVVCRERDSVRVYVKAQHTLHVNYGFLPDSSAIVMLKNAGYSPMLGKRESSMED